LDRLYTPKGKVEKLTFGVFFYLVEILQMSKKWGNMA